MPAARIASWAACAISRSTGTLRASGVPDWARSPATAAASMTAIAPSTCTLCGVRTIETSGRAAAKRRPSSSIPAVVAAASVGRSGGFASGIAIEPCGAMHANTSGTEGEYAAVGRDTWRDSGPARFARSGPSAAAILGVTAGPLASLVRARRRPLVRASSHSGTPRARSSTAEQGTFNPLVPGSNPGGLTRERGSRRRAVGVRGSESFHEVISNSRAGRLARLLAVRAPHTRKSSSSGQCEIEGRALPRHGLRPGLAAVATDDTPHGSEPDAGALELADRVKTLERREQLVLIGGVEADSVVPDVERARAVVLDRTDLDRWRPDRPRELPRVTDEIAQHRTEQSFVGLDLQAIFDAKAYGPGRRLPRVLSRDLARERAQVDRFAAKLGA